MSSGENLLKPFIYSATLVSAGTNGELFDFSDYDASFFELIRLVRLFIRLSECLKGLFYGYFSRLASGD